MGGINPYLKKQTIPKAAKAFKISVKPDQKVIAVDPAKIPYGATGLPGSILDIALNNGVDIDHACGGVVACSTCHVLVKKGLATCNEAQDEELDMIDQAPGNTFQSRLACQCVPNGEEDLEIEIPGWNRNLVRE